jgi:hypothetical protein
VTARWSFIGHPLRDDLPASWPEQIPVREIGDDGVWIYRERTEDVVPVPLHRCKCDARRLERTPGVRPCWQRPCGCQKFRDPNDDVAAAMDRHPAGKAIPTDKDAS